MEFTWKTSCGFNTYSVPFLSNPWKKFVFCHSLCIHYSLLNPPIPYGNSQRVANTPHVAQSALPHVLSFSVYDKNGKKIK